MEERVGWVVGAILSGSVITKSSSSTTFISNNDKAGGLGGYSTTQTKQSYSSGPVSGGGNIGGLVGDSESVSDSYSTGGVNGSSEVGGLVGNNAGTVQTNQVLHLVILLFEVLSIKMLETLIFLVLVVMEH